MSQHLAFLLFICVFALLCRRAQDNNGRHTLRMRMEFLSDQERVRSAACQYLQQTNGNKLSAKFWWSTKDCYKKHAHYTRIFDFAFNLLRHVLKPYTFKSLPVAEQRVLWSPWYVACSSWRLVVGSCFRCVIDGFIRFLFASKLIFGFVGKLYASFAPNCSLRSWHNFAGNSKT